MSIPLTNPFVRQPITRLANLSGRSREVNELEYTFQSTAGGQSHHCALIGPRGVGKSSLLLSSRELALEYKLLPVFVDLNLNKVKTSYSFWRDIYTSICSTSAQYGCWGGQNSSRFGVLVDGLNGKAESFILQLPRYWKDDANSPCPDTVIKQDLITVNEEAAASGFAGVLLCIDEADCLTIDFSYLQSLRNVFQNVPGMSLILAGTASLFAQISEVFSPIPRQFHKIDIDVFPHWSETQSLIKIALGKDLAAMEPTFETAIELHSITGGDPAEIQLYCHHMFKDAISHFPRRMDISSQEDLERMELSTNVYRAVFQEYRKFSPVEARETIKHLEGLSKEYIPSCPWLQNALLTCAENIVLYCAKEEFESGRALDEMVRADISGRIRESYQKLYHLNISTESEFLRLGDESCLRGLWSSLVKLEADEPWVWRHQPLNEIMLGDLHELLRIKTAAARSSNVYKEDAVFENILACVETEKFELLKNIRAAVEVTYSLADRIKTMSDDDILENVWTFQQGLEAISILLAALVRGKKNIVRIPVTFERDNTSLSCVFSYFGSSDPNDELNEIRTFIDERKEIFEQHSVEFAVGRPTMYSIPSFSKLHGIIKELGLDMNIDTAYESRKGCALFAEGKILESAEVFRDIVGVKRTPATLNNLAFCYLHLGQFQEARELLNEAIVANADPLFINNLAMVEVLESNSKAACSLLERAWEILKASNKWDSIVIYMNVVHDDVPNKIVVLEGVPTGVGVAFSLLSLGLLDKKEMERVFRKKLSPEKFKQFSDRKNIAVWKSVIMPTLGKTEFVKESISEEVKE